MNPTVQALEQLCAAHPQFLKKGGLAVALVVTDTARKSGLPLDPKTLRTPQGGQVAGLGKAAVQRILAEHGISKVLAEEGGRTSRGSLGLMEAYTNCLNQLHQQEQLDLKEAMSWWIRKVKDHFASKGPQFQFDKANSLKANIERLLAQARALQAAAGGTNYAGAMLQHLAGAKLDLVLGEGKVAHHGFSVADHSTGRNADFEIGDVAIHVTTHPGEALVRKCRENIDSGKRPVIVTLPEGLPAAAVRLGDAGLADRVDVLDISQFLTANVYERSGFQADQCRSTLEDLLRRYNSIVARCETDPCLTIRL